MFQQVVAVRVRLRTLCAPRGMPRQARSRSRTRIVKRSRAHIGTEAVKSFQDIDLASWDLRRGIRAYSAGGFSQGAARAVIHRASRSGCIALVAGSLGLERSGSPEVCSKLS